MWELSGKPHFPERFAWRGNAAVSTATGPPRTAGTAHRHRVRVLPAHRCCPILMAEGDTQHTPHAHAGRPHHALRWYMHQRQRHTLAHLDDCSHADTSIHFWMRLVGLIMDASATLPVCQAWPTKKSSILPLYCALSCDGHSSPGTG